MQFSSLIQQLSEYAIFTLDLQGVPTSWNLGVEQVLGYAKDEFAGRIHLSELFTPEDIEAGIPQRELELAREHGSSLNDRWMVRKGGIHFYAAGITTRINDEEGRMLGYAKFMRDQTDQRLVEERLRESEEHLRMALSASDMGTWSYRADKDEILLDEYLVRLLGLPELNHPWQLEQLGQVVHPDDRPLLANELEKAINNGHELRSEFRLALPDMETRWLRIQGRRVEGLEESVTIFAGACLDITAQRRSELALMEADRRKDEFLATLAHELRNPLAPLRNGLRILELADDDPDLRRDTQRMMDRQVGHMVRLIDDLMDMSRISRGTIELRKEVVRLHDVIEQALETSRPAIHKAGHRLNVLLFPDPVYVEADVTRLAQVFNNLLNNASKYTEQGGNIGLQLRLEGNEAIVSVTDDGLGIPPDLLNEVFEMFTQVDRSLERSRSGLGIGLSIVKQLVSMHGGRVEAYSEGLGKGSRFMVYLPLAEAPDPDHAIAASGSPATTEGDTSKKLHRILVVDDNADSATTLASIFRVLGHNVRMAMDGEQAVEMARSFMPELIFLDIGMPGMNGYEACRSIRQLPGGAAMVIVALTGWGQDEDRRRSEEAGFDQHLVKPIDGQTLAQLLLELERDGKG